MKNTLFSKNEQTEMLINSNAYKNSGHYSKMGYTCRELFMKYTPKLYTKIFQIDGFE